MSGRARLKKNYHFLSLWQIAGIGIRKKFKRVLLSCFSLWFYNNAYSERTDARNQK